MQIREVVSKNITFIAFAILFALHLAFLQADPDCNISRSHGPWTDEGLYSYQIRNAIAGDGIGLHNSACFVVTPAFGTLLYLPFQLFGTTLPVGRTTVMLLWLGVLLLTFRPRDTLRITGLLMVPIVFMQYHVFHFSHYCMAEILSVVAILAAIAFLFRIFAGDNKNTKNHICAAAFLAFSCMLKIQFLYILPLAIVFTILWLITTRIRKENDIQPILRSFLIHLCILAVPVLLYLMFWYIPTKEFYDHVIGKLVEGSFLEISQLNLAGILLDIWGRFQLNVLNAGEFTLIAVAFFVALVAGFRRVFSRTSSRNFRLLFLLTFSWVILESHKMTLTYLPSRYLMPFYFSMGMLVALVIGEYIQLFRSNAKHKLKYAMYLFVAAVFVFNFANLIASFNRRTYSIRAASGYFQQVDFGNRPLMGAWAPGLSWGSNIVSYPIWKDDFNDKRVIETFNPKAIITEPGEGDSNGAFQSAEVDLRDYSDSVVQRRIGHWDVLIFWLK
ncbi:MAG: hypothetical protein KKA07_16080, partial [Bacteroidetes bacterium]|nr:hypothetical protein [Bacteroidota bacterium]MBU1720583.1 hypothetical protein [Bacteroidota bacterium]